MARYPCYVCSVNCDDNCIYCETCNTWSHYSCQEIDRSERKEWCKNKKTAYICIRCRTNDDGNYDYFTALERLNQATKGDGDEKCLIEIAEHEKLYLKKVSLQASLHADFSKNKQDFVANSLLSHYHLSDLVALHSTPDGNCFFNSISTLLCGDETRSIELRYRCSLEMILNKKQLMMHPQYERLTPLSPDSDQECITCTKRGSRSSMFMFLAMSKVLNMPVKVVYPGVNGYNYTFKVMNTFIRPPFSDPCIGKLNLMWTTLKLPATPPGNGCVWVPNHIVPLVDSVKRGPIQQMTEHFKTNTSLQTTAPLEKNIAALSEKVIAINDEKTNDNNIVKKRKLKKAKVSKRKGAIQKAYDQSSQQMLNDIDECNTTIITEDELQEPDISENDIDGPASPMAALNRTYTIRTDDTLEEKMETNTQTESDVSFNISNRDFSNQPTPLEVSLPDLKLDGDVIPDAPVSFEVVEAGSKRGGKKLTSSDGYTYTVRNVKNKRTYWTCSVRGKTLKCHASVKQYMDMFTQSLNGHNHPADPGAAKKVKIAAKVKEIAKERVFEPAASIVERVMKEITSTEDFNLPRPENLVRAANYHRRQRPDDAVSLDFERISVTQLQPGSHKLPTSDLYSLELFECVESTTACWHKRINGKAWRANLPLYVLIPLLYGESETVDLQIRLISEHLLTRIQRKKIR